MVFASIYNYLTGAADETDATTTTTDVPVRPVPVEAIDQDWELIETELTSGETVVPAVPVPCGSAKHETSANGARVQRRKNTKKISKYLF